ncbi:low molecular weight protein-tyrosine-phosphatase [Polycladomyces subterraneus]|uniref:protein-tyrosine-phosphatase n=1 Tax=Polycladomyces subterraneus TaxID=1016997 RepID=A0ABT8IMA2_9BACL|nr:low molecular weight protein-tyrosine-phosphatase [Polycladomyces subterraneus]MDN4593918.1 low molecular weight phosphotyrosine protein phosphatase [Polycladomyces subterraneus]
MISVLFVCLGNICRSPMAEAVFRHMVKEEGLEDRIRVDSAGTGDWHTGEPPHHGTRRILKQYGIAHEGIRARKVKKQDLEDFDYIIAMDDSNLSHLRRLADRNHQHLYRLTDFIPETTYTEVPDPYYTGNFEEVYELVSAGCRGLLERIKEEQGWK